MHNNDKKQKDNNFLKKIKELDLKIDAAKATIKHNNMMKDELDNINASYNRCLEILSRSATGKTINQKYNDLYTENRINHIKALDHLDTQSSETQKNIDIYLDERDILKDKYKEEQEKEKKESSN